MSTKPHVTIEVIWQDDHMVEIAASATNGTFSGRTQAYTAYDDLQALSDDLRGFPKSRSQEVEYDAGDDFSLRFYSFDRSGHTAVQVHLAANVPTESRPEERHEATLEVRVEPAAIDRFAEQLALMVAANAGAATLVGVPSRRSDA